jgi:hypothetical protein
MRVFVVAIALFAVGCVTPTPPAEPDLARAAAPPPVAAPPSGAAAAPSQPITAEVEIGGTVTRPAGAKGDATVWIVDAPCWQPGGRAFGSAKTAAGDKFFLEVYVPQGTQLWVCGAVGDGTKPLEIYGQSDRAPLLGKGTGEVTFMGLSVPLKKGKKVTAPGKR